MPTSRLLSLDVFRGITIAGMVLVNNPGSWEHIYWPLEHAQWHGWTPTDLVFPFFLFIVGVSITLALGNRVESGGSKRDLYLKIIKRTLIIFGIGLVLNALPYFSLAELRIPGVLQRIAVCYFFASIIFLNTRWRTQIGIAIALLLVYWILVKFIPAPGFAAGDLTKEGSLPSFIDRVVFGKHVWAQAKVYDPEGLLSTIPALVTTLIGVLTGHWLRNDKTRMEKVAGMFVAGAVLTAIGWGWNAFFPINKALWTSSYVMFTGGLALQFLGLCYWLIDIKGYRRWAKPFEIFGLNAIALYILADIIAVLLGVINVGGDSLGGWIYAHLFASWTSPLNASLAFAICFVLVCFFFMWLLYRRRIFIKI
ncbi:MAG TPA: heparan-alpha-glucosaminide N-acetyltransferase domain-containing protein [Pyrinomonadaceae bacterium]|nr:heparan-alpha-glucosaminide N-acetyltransferase domain-containing protein [Pyrinomonadaceae bacterium]